MSTGEILVLHHPTTISQRYQAMVHCGSIRQTASIMTMNKECLRTGDKANVKFRFIKHPEYIKVGQRMVFREGRTKAVGNILKPLPHVSTTNFNRAKPSKIQQARQGQLANAALSATAPVASSSNDGVKENLELLEISTDKRNSARPRGGKRKRGGPMTSSQNSENISAGNSSNAQ